MCHIGLFWTLLLVGKLTWKKVLRCFSRAQWTIFNSGAISIEMRFEFFFTMALATVRLPLSTANINGFISELSDANVSAPLQLNNCTMVIIQSFLGADLVSILSVLRPKLWRCHNTLKIFTYYCSVHKFNMPCCYGSKGIMYFAYTPNKGMQTTARWCLWWVASQIEGVGL